MSGTGSTTATFGALLGSDQATITITGQTGILSTSHVEAYLDPTQTPTADHSADEHVLADIDVRVENIVAATGFTIILQARGGFLQYGYYNVTWVWV